jgi:hypothetical protein
LLRNAQKRDKTIEQNQPREREKKTEGKKNAFFVMSPDGLFWKKSFFVFLNSPCYEKIDKKIKNQNQNKTK